jgi:hypothetical protein
MESNLSHKQNI